MVTSNVERYLGEAIRSILDQTFRDFEFIIGDFGSTDRTREIVARHAAADPRIKMIDIPPCPLPEARNRAWTIAAGRYIAVMDADDIAHPNRLEWEVGFLESHPRVGVVGGGTEWIDRQGKILRRDRFPETNQEIQAELANRCTFCHPTTLIRKEALERVGGYRPLFTVAHDYDLWLRIAEHFECANLSAIVF
jgi:glycosyltransferase involved in cell wall biosynthesis